MNVFGVTQRTFHRPEAVNVLSAEGHAEAMNNAKREYTVAARSNAHESFEKILKVFEGLDRGQQ